MNDSQAVPLEEIVEVKNKVSSEGVYRIEMTGKENIIYEGSDSEYKEAYRVVNPGEKLIAIYIKRPSKIEVLGLRRPPMQSVLTH